MTSRSDFDRSTASRLLALAAALCALLQVASGCAFSSRVQTPRSSWEQILATTAIDRALEHVLGASGQVLVGMVHGDIEVVPIASLSDDTDALNRRPRIPPHANWADVASSMGA